MDTAQWPQDVGLMKPMDHHNNQLHHQDEINRAIGGERRATRPQEQLNCPRCKSTNTKFCYYNNYSLTQPRYFCKGCRRYWTNGGSLRNVPVGGGSRKNKRPSATATSPYKLPDLNPPIASSSLHQNPNNTHLSGQDLNLSFQVIQQEHPHHRQGSFIQLPKMENHESNNHHNNTSSSSSASALDLLRTGIASRGLNSFTPMPMPDSNTLYSASAGFTMQEFKPTQLSFPVETLGNSARFENNGGAAAGRLFFPFGDFSKQLAATADAEQDKDRHWHGMLQGGGGSW